MHIYIITDNMLYFLSFTMFLFRGCVLWTTIQYVYIDISNDTYININNNRYFITFPDSID